MRFFLRLSGALLLGAVLLGTDRLFAAPIDLTVTEGPRAMHIAEGFLPPAWAIFWTALCLPFWFAGFRTLKRQSEARPESRLLLALAAAFSFVLSALKIPSITGSSSHPTGVGLGAMLFGPATMTILGTIVLLFQALLLAHGGITTLGANGFSMAIVGPYAAYGIFKLLRSLGADRSIAVFAGAAIANLATYLTTSLQLALAFPLAEGGVPAAFLRFGTLFAPTQVPLAIIEGILTVIIVRALLAQGAEEMRHTQLAGETG